jgi:hypothetical protein
MCELTTFACTLDTLTMVNLCIRQQWASLHGEIAVAPRIIYPLLRDDPVIVEIHGSEDLSIDYGGLLLDCVENGVLELNRERLERRAPLANDEFAVAVLILPNRRQTRHVSVEPQRKKAHHVLLTVCETFGSDSG